MARTALWFALLAACPLGAPTALAQAGDAPTPAPVLAAPEAPTPAPVLAAPEAPAPAPVPEAEPASLPQPAIEVGPVGSPGDAPVAALPAMEWEPGPADARMDAPIDAAGDAPAAGTARWRGALDGRLHYFWERSTRVVVPEAQLRAQSPDGLRVSGGYLLDVITSASIAFTGSGEDALHQEYRHQAGVGVGKEFDLGGDSQLDAEMQARLSTESDYRSLPFVAANFALSRDQRNSVIRWGGSVIHDNVRANNDPSFRGTLDGVSASYSVEQVLNRLSVLTVGYQMGHLWGFLGNPYRNTQMENAGMREAPPRQRTRHALSMRFQQFIPLTGSAVHLLAKGYADTWGIRAMAPEVRVYQSLGPLLVRARYRYYRQSRADFQRDTYPGDWSGPNTADPKLAAFRGHMYGLRMDLFMGFLAGSFLDFAEGASIYMNLDRQRTGISFGDAVVGSAGGVLPF